MGVSAFEICINIAICWRSESGTVNRPLPLDFPPEDGDPRSAALSTSAVPVAESSTRLSSGTVVEEEEDATTVVVVADALAAVVIVEEAAGKKNHNISFPS